MKLRVLPPAEKAAVKELINEKLIAARTRTVPDFDHKPSTSPCYKDLPPAIKRAADSATRKDGALIGMR